MSEFVLAVAHGAEGDLDNHDRGTEGTQGESGDGRIEAPVPSSLTSAPP